MTMPTTPPASAPSGYRADAWARGPERIYNRLAEDLVDSSPVSLRGGRVLDVGAGTGAASRAIARAGGRPVAVDVEVTMLHHRCGERPPAVAGDALCLPFCSGRFDAVVAAFVLSHVPEPGQALQEMARVTRPRGVVLAVTFGAANHQPVKEIVDDVLARHGYQPPPWYVSLKHTLEPLVATTLALGELATAAGLDDVEVARRDVDIGVLTAEDLVDWRLGMAHTADFVDQLPAATRAQVRDEALTATRRSDRRTRFSVVALAARTPS
jgi:SAM-dependent methyltransferase